MTYFAPVSETTPDFQLLGGVITPQLRSSSPTLELLGRLFAAQNETNQRLSRIETQLALLSSHQRERDVQVLSSSTKVKEGWFKANLKVIGFRSTLMTTEIGTEHEFDIPLLLRFKGKSITFNLQWIGQKDLSSEKIQKVTSKIKESMVFYFKKFEEKKCTEQQNVPIEKVAVSCSYPPNIVVTLYIDQYLPLSFQQGGYLCFALSSKKNEEKFILLEDGLIISKLPAGEDKHAVGLEYLKKKKDKYFRASWYPRLLELIKQYSLNGEDEEQKPRKRVRSSRDLGDRKPPKSPRLEEKQVLPPPLADGAAGKLEEFPAWTLLSSNPKEWILNPDQMGLPEGRQSQLVPVHRQTELTIDLRQAGWSTYHSEPEWEQGGY